MTITKLHTVEDLWALGSAGNYELIEGELHEVSPSEGFSSEISLNFVEALRPFLRKYKLGRITGEGAGYLLARNPDTVLCPDVGFVRRERVPGGLPRGRFVPSPPDLAIEVMSASDRYADMATKAARYLAAGTRIVWIVRPQDRTVAVISARRSPMILDIDQTLDGEDVLPGFSMPVVDVFKDPLDD